MINMVSLQTIKITDVLQSIPDGIILFTPDRQVLFANAAASRLTGLPQQGFYLAELTRLLQARVSVNLEDAVEAVLREMTPVHLRDVQVVSFFYEFFITPCYDAAQKITGGIIVMHDVTDRIELDRHKSEFIDLASHQLRTPLTAIEWVAETFLRKEKLTEAGRGYLQDISFSAKRLNALVKLLLNASRIESAIEVVPESTDLVGLMNEYFREYQALFEKKNLTFLFSHPDNLVVLTDPNLFGHILQNLVCNSIDYTPAGGKIEVLLEKRDHTFLLTVRNTSAAIPEKDQGRIFEKFFRSPAAVAMKPDGTGLGLYIVSEAVKLLGGKIWFESPTLKEEGIGTAFYVELPLQARTREGGKHLVDHPFE